MTNDSEERKPVIVHPPMSPPTSADPQTQLAIEKQAKPPKGPGAADRHAASVNRHIEDLTAERTRLVQEIADARIAHADEVRSLRSQIDQLSPENARLAEAYAATLAVNILTTVLTGVGASLISAAGYTQTDIAKFSILFLGIGTFIAGCVLQVTATWRSVAFRRRPKD